MYDIIREVGQGEVDREGNLNIAGMYNFLQDCSYAQIMSNEKFREEFARDNKGMFLISRQLDILKKPKFGDKLLIRTTIYMLNRVMGFRNTVIYDAATMEPMIVTYAGGAFVDLTSGGACQMSDELVATVPIEPKVEMEYLPRKIRIPTDGGTEATTFRIYRSHLDSYRHTNNAHYVSMAIDAIDKDLDIKRIRVEYRKPAQLGDNVHSTIYDNNGTYTVVLSSDAAEIFAIVEIERN